MQEYYYREWFPWRTFILGKEGVLGLEIFITKDNETVQTTCFEKGCWVNLIDPTTEEIKTVTDLLDLSPEVLAYPLDAEERARIEYEDNYVLVLVDIPIKDAGHAPEFYTIPLGMIIAGDYFVTVCLRDTPILREFSAGIHKDFFTYKKTRFVLQILFSIASTYLKYLKQINKKTDETEKKLLESLRNKEFFTLLNLEKSLVFFTTSIKANEIVLEKLLRSKVIPMYQEDEDLLEDVIIENKQAIEMVHIYSSILSGMMDAFASVISNNLNIVMKLLTVVTIILAIPTMVFSFYGMNVNLPFQNAPYAFLFTLLLSTGLSVITLIYMLNRRIV